MAPFLEPLTRGEEVTWRNPPGGARRWAYRVHEALYAAQANRDLFGPLAEARERYRIEEVSDSEVRAVPAERRVVEVIVGPAQSTVELAGPSSLESIKAQWIEAIGSGIQKLYLPQARLTVEELRELWIWAKQTGLAIFELDGALTLLPDSPDYVGLTWSPNDG